MFTSNFQKIEGQEEEILAKYNHSLEEFMTSILNNLLDLYEISGEYEPTPPLISRAKWLSQHSSVSSWKLKLLNILGYHRLCKLNRLIHKYTDANRKALSSQLTTCH